MPESTEYTPPSTPLSTLGRPLTYTIEEDPLVEAQENLMADFCEPAKPLGRLSSQKSIEEHIGSEALTDHPEKMLLSDKALRSLDRTSFYARYGQNAMHQLRRNQSSTESKLNLLRIIARAFELDLNNQTQAFNSFPKNRLLVQRLINHGAELGPFKEVMPILRRLCKAVEVQPETIQYQGQSLPSDEEIYKDPRFLADQPLIDRYKNQKEVFSFATIQQHKNSAEKELYMSEIQKMSRLKELANAGKISGDIFADNFSEFFERPFLEQDFTKENMHVWLRFFKAFEYPIDSIYYRDGDGRRRSLDRHSVFELTTINEEQNVPSAFQTKRGTSQRIKLGNKELGKNTQISIRRLYDSVRRPGFDDAQVDIADSVLINNRERWNMHLGANCWYAPGAGWAPELFAVLARVNELINEGRLSTSYYIYSRNTYNVFQNPLPISDFPADTIKYLIRYCKAIEYDMSTIQMQMEDGSIKKLSEMKDHGSRTLSSKDKRQLTALFKSPTIDSLSNFIEEYISTENSLDSLAKEIRNRSPKKLKLNNQQLDHLISHIAEDEIHGGYVLLNSLFKLTAAQKEQTLFKLGFDADSASKIVLASDALPKPIAETISKYSFNITTPLAAHRLLSSHHLAEDFSQALSDIEDTPGITTPDIIVILLSVLHSKDSEIKNNRGLIVRAIATRLQSGYLDERKDDMRKLVAEQLQVNESQILKSIDKILSLKKIKKEHATQMTDFLLEASLSGLSNKKINSYLKQLFKKSDSVIQEFEALQNQPHKTQPMIDHKAILNLSNEVLVSSSMSQDDMLNGYFSESPAS